MEPSGKMSGASFTRSAVSTLTLQTINPDLPCPMHSHPRRWLSAVQQWWCIHAHTRASTLSSLSKQSRRERERERAGGQLGLIMAQNASQWEWHSDNAVAYAINHRMHPYEQLNLTGTRTMLM
jgi:hypothetical protein